MAHSEKDGIEKVGDLIKDIRVAMLTTVDADGALRSRPMATQSTPFDGELWFFTAADSTKAGEIGRHGQVNLSYASSGDGSYVSLSGTGKVVRDAAKAKELWNPFVEAWFPGGVADPELALLHVEVDQAEYWDAPSGKMVQLAGMVKAVATGQRYHADPGEHGKVEV
jgi:general stress protein 26